ncbi:regulator [Ureibacillus massiliensis 4400831 = CIP 108448 = CCUG 49529]|uniref:Putative 4-hydroxy-4-methyl-2-oxoglutarate aldolase n=1 Tax=Ureibacillus massiliensis 4400831 = CIP 108448 = CCUG 49529 TaxID=1211035 RepID=A0A0A3J1U5_9BACL|nr:RraA family protein [Ureibacillus massiliensis]KGR89680.1 regulator [Ureibacillus massiliensis 4400831 = CIP 108448 = CCUG 49529]
METITIQERFLALPTTAISDATGGHTNVDASIKPLSDHFKIAGRVVTVRLPDGENGAVLEAISKAEKGDILVIDAKGNRNRAVAGDFVVSLAKGVGIQGFVVDGVIRDIAAIRELDFPVFALGTTVAAGNKHGGGAVGVPISIGGVAIHPGDFVIGDIDGVIVVPQTDLEKVVEAAEEKLAKDMAREREALGDGEASIRAYLAKVLAK